jgi:hypothetical protein
MMFKPYIPLNMKERSGGKKSQPGVFDAILNGNKMQLVFFIMLSIVFILAVPFCLEYGKLVQSLKEGNLSYEWPEYTDLSIAFVSMLVMLTTRELVVRFGPALADKLIKPNYQGPERVERIERLLFHGYKSIWFSIAVVMGWYVSKESPWLPTIMLGRGDANLIHKGWPYLDVSSFPYLDKFLMVQLGFHSHILVTHFTEPPKKNYIEMLLHHTLTILLLGLAYFLNFHGGSLLVLLSHDISDIFVSGARALMDTAYSKLMFSLYLCLMATWVVMRLYVFPVLIIYPTIWGTAFHETELIPGYYIMAIMVHFLWIMNIYWFIMLSKIGYSFIVKKKTEDLVEGVESKDKTQ